MMRRACTLLAVAMAGVFALAGRAWAEDWLQTGHDAYNTFASQDQVKLPLTDIWTLPRGLPCAVAFGRVYSVVNTRNAGVSSLVCVSARTGVLLWRRELWSNAETGYIDYDVFAPTVSPDGVVYLIDTQLAGGGLAPGVRAFHAITGQPVGSYVLSRTGEDPALLFAKDTDQELLPPNGLNLRQYRGFDPLIVPKLLLNGDQLLTSLAPCLFQSLTPRAPARYFVLSHLEQQFNPVKKGFETVSYDGNAYPLHVSAGKGVIVAGYWLRRNDNHEPNFLAGIEGPFLRWHRDFPWRVRTVGVDNGTLFSIMSGSHDTHVVAALNAQDGQTRWLYPPRWPEPWDPLTFPTKDNQLVLAGGKVFAFTEKLDLVALDQRDGHLLWRLRPGGFPLAASRDHLFVRAWQPVVRPSGPAFQMAAVRLSDGKVEWTQESPPLNDPQGFRRVAISDGQIFARNAPGLTAFAPAERMFRLAIDTNQKEFYQPEDPAAAAAHPGPIVPRLVDYAADATVVRVPWNEPLTESSRKLTERRKTASGLPLLLQVEWLDPQRAAVLGAKPTELPARTAFLARCRALAAEYQPEHLDLAPEVNVYLARHPEQLDAVRDLLTAAVKEVRAVSGKTRVLLSLNCEVLYGLYGKGSTAPFGKLELAGRQDLAPLKTLLAVVDELGLASCPQAAFPSPVDVPRDYFLAVKQALEAKRLVVSNLRVELRENTPAGQVEQASFLKHLTQNCYWLDAALVACPDLPLSPPPLPIPEALNKANARPILPSVAAVDALDIWRDVLRWERVERLTLSPNLPAPPAGAASAQ